MARVLGLAALEDETIRLLQEHGARLDSPR
jgi:hypothetical protein